MRVRAAVADLGHALKSRGTAQVAYLGLGSNVGDRLAHLQAAVDRLAADLVSDVEAVSSVYATTPVGGPPQEDFYNLAIRLLTRRSPLGVLALAQRVERAGGRVREVRHGPRTIDVDVLLYADRVVRRPQLEVPHPRLTGRAFAIVPLIEVAPGRRLPDGTTLTGALARLAPVEGVTAIGRQVLVPGEATDHAPPR